MYQRDLIIEVDIFMVLYNGCLRHNTFQGHPIRLQSVSKKRLTSFLLRFSSITRSSSRNLNPYCIIFAVRSPFQLASMTSFLYHFSRDSSFCVQKSSINGFPLCDLRQYHHQRQNIVEPVDFANLILGMLVDARGRGTSPILKVRISEIWLFGIAEEDEALSS